MSEHQTKQIIDHLERRVVDITRRYKIMMQELQQLKKENQTLKETIDAQQIQIARDEDMIKALSTQHLMAYNKEAKDALKTYLDQVITLIDTNIQLLK